MGGIVGTTLKGYFCGRKRVREGARERKTGIEQKIANKWRDEAELEGLINARQKHDYTRATQHTEARTINKKHTIAGLY